MRDIIWSVLAAGVLLTGFSANAQEGVSPVDCDSLEPSRAIPGCTLLIGLPGIPDNIEALAYLKRGMAQNALQNLDAAIVDLEKSRALNAGDFTVHNELGLAYLDKGDPKRAIATFDDGLKIEPGHADLYYNRGISYIKLGDFDHAVADLNEAIKLSPSGDTAFVDNGKIERAEINHAATNYYKALASVYSRKGDFDRAIATDNDAIKRFPEYAYVYVIRAETYTTKGDFTAALADLGRAAKLDPTSSRTFGARAFLRFKTGDFAGAAADYDKAWSIDPREVGMPMDYVPIWLYLTQSRSASKSLATDALIRLSPQIDQAHWPYPIVKLLLGQASPEQTAAAAQTPDAKCEANFYIGEWLQLHDDKEGARKKYEAARDTCQKMTFEFEGAEADLPRIGVR